ncbi:MAG: hypothetical protein WCE63_16515 [Acidobacteriaceae bacterium]
MSLFRRGDVWWYEFWFRERNTELQIVPDDLFQRVQDGQTAIGALEQSR